MPGAMVHDVGPEEDAPEAQFLYTAARLGHGVLDVEGGDHASPDEAGGVGLAEVGEPVVVGTGHSCGEPGGHIGDGQGEQATGGVDHRHVYPLLVHGPKLHLARPAALLIGLEAYLVLGKALASAALLVPHGAGISAPRLPIGADQAQVTHCVGEPTRRLVLKLGVYVPLPQVWRLDD